MKNRIRVVHVCTLISVFMSVSAFAQSDSTTVKKCKWGGNLSYFITSFSEFTSITPQATLVCGKHYMAVGPKLGILPGSNHDKAFGADIDYRFYPNANEKRFSLFFFTHFEFAYSQYNYTGPYYYYEVRYNASRQYKNYGLGLYGGYGFNIRFCKNFYFNHSLGIGPGINGGHTKVDVADAPQLSYEQTERFFDMGMPVVMLNFGIGYNLK